jgi:hypothetical protein
MYGISAARAVLSCCDHVHVLDISFRVYSISTNAVALPCTDWRGSRPFGGIIYIYIYIYIHARSYASLYSRYFSRCIMEIWVHVWNDYKMEHEKTGLDDNRYDVDTT